MQVPSIPSREAHHSHLGLCQPRRLPSVSGGAGTGGGEARPVTGLQGLPAHSAGCHTVTILYVEFCITQSVSCLEYMRSCQYYYIVASQVFLGRWQASQTVREAGFSRVQCAHAHWPEVAVEATLGVGWVVEGGWVGEEWAAETSCSTVAHGSLLCQRSASALSPVLMVVHS